MKYLHQRYSRLNFNDISSLAIQDNVLYTNQTTVE